MGLRLNSFYYPTRPVAKRLLPDPTRPDPTRPAGIPVTRTTRSSPTKGWVGYTRVPRVRVSLHTPIFTAVVLSKRLSSIVGLIKSINFLGCLAGYRVTNHFLFTFNCPNNFQISLLPSRSTMAAWVRSILMDITITYMYF